MLIIRDGEKNILTAGNVFYNSHKQKAQVGEAQ